MKEKILAALKTKFEGVQDATLLRIADKLSKTITDENQVQTATDGVTTQQIIDSYADARVAEAIATHKKSQTKKTETDKGSDKQDDTTQTEETDMAKLLKAVDTLQKQFNQQQAKSTQQQMREKLSATLKGKVPEKHLSKLLGNRTIEKEEDIETVATELEASWNELKQEFTNEQVAPGPGGGGLKTTQLASDLAGWRKDKGLSEKPEIKKT